MLMHESGRYGYLCAHDGSALSNDMAARGCGMRIEDYELGLTELSAAGIIHHDKNKVIFDPELLEQVKVRNLFAKYEAYWISKHEADAANHRKFRDPSYDAANISSFLDSKDSSTKDSKKLSPRKTSWPADFILTPALSKYALDHGVAEPSQTWEHFENHHKARRSVFADWDRAWYTWVLNSAKFNKGGAHEAIGRRQRETDRVNREAIRRMG